MARKHDPNLADDIDRGRRAAVAQGVVTPFIEERIVKINKKLVNQYRSGELTQQLMIGSIGELSALSDLIQELEHAQRIAIGASEKEYG